MKKESEALCIDEIGDISEEAIKTVEKRIKERGTKKQSGVFRMEGARKETEMYSELLSKKTIKKTKNEK